MLSQSSYWTSWIEQNDKTPWKIVLDLSKVSQLLWAILFLQVDPSLFFFFAHLTAQISICLKWNRMRNMCVTRVFLSDHDHSLCNIINKCHVHNTLIYLSHLITLSNSTYNPLHLFHLSNVIDSISLLSFWKWTPFFCSPGINRSLARFAAAVISFNFWGVTFDSAENLPSLLLVSHNLSI